MTAVPRPRWSGPPQQRDATLLLTLAAFLITARIPMGFVALLLLPATVVVVHGLRLNAHLPRPVHQLLLVCGVAALLGVLTTRPTLLAGTGNNLIIIVAITLVATAIFRGHLRDRAATRLFDGLYLGLLFNWLLSLFEAASGFKFLPLLYPTANTASEVAKNRFFVTALFPNYNDYSVSMTILFLCVLARMIFNRKAPGPRLALGRWFVLATTAFFIVHMGSRGALGGLVIGAAVLGVLSVRIVRPRAITFRLVVGLGGIALAAVAGLMLSPWVQDNSTATRGIIARKARQLIMEDPIRALIGYGSNSEYLRAGRARYGNILLDPHNMLLEFVIWFGVPALLLYLLCWWSITRRGILTLRRNPGWRTVAACTVTAIYPILGIVTSSTLRYHQVWLWLLVAFAGLQALAEREPEPAPLAEGSAAAQPHQVIHQ